MEDTGSPGDPGSMACRENAVSQSGDTILIRVPNWIGDTVMSTAALAGLRQLAPEATLAILAKPWVVPVIAHHPAVDILMIHDPRRFPARIIDFFRTVHRIRAIKPRRGILFHKNFESALLFFAAGIPDRIGRPTDGRSILLTRRVRLDAEVLRGHQVHHYRFIVSAAAGKPCPVVRPRVYLSTEDCDAADAYLADYAGRGPVIPVAAGAAYGAAKCWPPDRMAEFVAKIVRQLEARVVFLGSDREREVSQKIRDTAGIQARIMAGDQPMGVQAALISRAGICVANDSGLMHVAAALPSVRTVAIFGPTVPAETAPFGEGHIILHHPTRCWPCKHRECPLDHECMRSITVDEVLNAVETIVSCR